MHFNMGWATIQQPMDTVLLGKRKGERKEDQNVLVQWANSQSHFAAGRNIF